MTEPIITRVAILWTQLSGYMNACLKQLAQTEGVEIFVSNMRVTKDAPYDDSLFSWIEERYEWDVRLDETELLSRLEKFRPNIIVSSGWNVPGHRHILKKFRSRAVRIITVDNPWRGTIKQRLGGMISRFYLKPICDALFVAGERQAVFAHHLGFPQRRILRGVLSCDHQKFSAIHFERQHLSDESHAFVYVGRLAAEKGLDVLVEAYRRYRQSVAEPWPLKCYGTGPLKAMLEPVEGIELMGFCQPGDLPGELLRANCLILPSTFEPWALVLHEAASAGLALICSAEVGASVHLVQTGYNGYVVETGDVDELASAMLQYTALHEGQRMIMAENSYLMSLQFTPERWANNLLDGAYRILREMEA
ncbi:glycosyltransferase family 4 protein [Methylomonas sp. YC3]